MSYSSALQGNSWSLIHRGSPHQSALGWNNSAARQTTLKSLWPKTMRRCSRLTGGVDRLLLKSVVVYTWIHILSCGWVYLDLTYLCWVLSLRMGSGQLQSFYSRNQAREAMSLWGMLFSWQKEKPPKAWHIFAMSLKVSGWSSHTVTSAHIPLPQVNQKVLPKCWDQERYSTRET